MSTTCIYFYSRATYIYRYLRFRKRERISHLDTGNAKPEVKSACTIGSLLPKENEEIVIFQMLISLDPFAIIFPQYADGKFRKFFHDIQERYIIVVYFSRNYFQRNTRWFNNKVGYNIVPWIWGGIRQFPEFHMKTKIREEQKFHTISGEIFEFKYLR